MAFSDEMKTMCESLATSRSDRQKFMGDFQRSCNSDRRNRMEGIKERKGSLNRIFGDVHVMIKHFHTDRGKMAQEFRKMGESLRQMLEESFEKNRRAVRGFLREFRAQHKALSGKQQEELEAFCRGIRRDVGQMRGETHQMMKGFAHAQDALRADLGKAHKMFQEFASGKFQPRAAAKPKMSSLKARIMATLKGSPEGMTPKELSYAIGTPEKSLTRFLMRMRREGDIRRQKNTFFAR